MLIHEIRTGQSRDGSRKAVLFANEKEDLPAGSLALLTQFFHQKHIHAVAGYDGGHVLRVRYFESDEQLRTMLTKDFAEWAKTQPKGLKEGQQLIDKDLPFLPLDQHGKQPFAWSRFSRQYATPMVGALSFVSAGAMMGADTLNLRNSELHSIHRTKNAISMAATGFFLVASAALAGLGFAAVRKPSTTELLMQLEPRLNEAPENIGKKEKHNVFRRYSDYGLNNPWHVATLLNFVGVVVKGVSHAIPSWQKVRIGTDIVKRHKLDSMELAALGSSLVSLGLIATARPVAENSILGIQSYNKSLQSQDPLAQRYHSISQSLISPFSTTNDQGKDGHLNMKAAGVLGMASNGLFGTKGAIDLAAGLRFKDALALEQRKNWPLTLLVPFNIAADYLTTLSKPRYSYSLDAIAADAAEMIAHKLNMKTVSTETITRQAYILSELLADHPRVTQSAHQLREAIGARLALDYGYKMPVAGEGLREYQHLMEISPFEAAPTKAPEAIAHKEEQPGKFVARLQQEQPLIRSIA